jgi:hypothetical protein
MTAEPLTDPSQVALAVYPPAIDVSTNANKQVFAPQFSVANLSSTAPVSMSRALLRVPVSTAGTNLATNTDFAPSADTPGWTLASGPSKEGYVAFTLLPDDGVGTIAPGGSVAFTLNNVEVSPGPPGDAVLPFEARTSLGDWATQARIELTTPSIVPTLTRHSVTPADDPQQATILQGQSAIIRWTSTGAAYCTIVDDQGNTWKGLPTSGTISNTPAVGDATILEDPALACYYNRTYTLSAFAADAQSPDQWSGTAIVQLPTIFSFAVSPANIDTVGQTVTVSWSVANIDPARGEITLTFTPADGTGSHTLAIPQSQTSGSGVLTPTPQTTTTYSFAVNNGYGVSASSIPAKVTSPLPMDWIEISGLETVPKPSGNPNMGLVRFKNRLWC